MAPGVRVTTSRRFRTTSTLVDDGDAVLVVDPAWDADELAGLAADAVAGAPSTVVGLATHVHYDHVLWHPGLGDGPRWASPATVAALGTGRGELLAPLVGDLPDDLVGLAGRLTPLTADPTPGREPTGDRGPILVPWPGREVRCWPHDAHAVGHLAVELADVEVVLAGDMCSDVELPMPADDDVDLSAYLAGLDRLAPVVARAAVLVPGHGTPTDRPAQRLDADRRYLDAILAGRPVDDPRCGLPDMPALHAANLRRARRHRG